MIKAGGQVLCAMGAGVLSFGWGVLVVAVFVAVAVTMVGAVVGALYLMEYMLGPESVHIVTIILPSIMGMMIVWLAWVIGSEDKYDKFYRRCLEYWSSNP